MYCHSLFVGTGVNEENHDITREPVLAVDSNLYYFPNAIENIVDTLFDYLFEIR